MKFNRKPILCLDFDGVIHSYTSGWKGPRTITDPPVDGAIDFLIEASQEFKIAVFSSRGLYWFGRWAMKRAIYRWAYEKFMQVQANDPYNRATYEYVTDMGARTYEPWSETCDYAARKLVKSLSFPRQKPPAMVSLDDRAMQFKGAWPHPLELKKFKPWNRKDLNNPESTGELS